MKMNKHYISPADHLLNQWDQTHPKTPSQQAEIKKHQRIHQLRDDPYARDS